MNENFVSTIPNDIELTEVLRKALKVNGYVAPNNYEWHNGEALYCGDTIVGRATPGEQKAVEATERAAQVWPETYLHVRECRSGLEWVVPIADNDPMNIETLVDRWIVQEYGGELVRDGGFMPRLEGDYYAQIKTDGRPPESAVCWSSGGFYLKGAQ